MYSKTPQTRQQTSMHRARIAGQGQASFGNLFPASKGKPFKANIQMPSVYPGKPVAGGKIRIDFESSFLNPDDGTSWAAELQVTPQGRVAREFIPIQKTWRNFKEGKRVKVSFSEEYKPGTVLEISQASSKENGYYGRNYFVVTPQGLKVIGNIFDKGAKAEVVSALGVKDLVWAFFR